MTPIKILHASDLHIAVNDRRRAENERFKDLDPRDWSLQNLLRGGRVVRDLLKAFKDKVAVSSSYDREILLAFAQFAYKYGKRFDADGNVIGGCLDAVLLTGDLATTGTANDISKAREFLEDLPGRSGYRSAKSEPTLKGLEIPVAYLPGNHDRFIWPTDELAWYIPVIDLGFPKFFDAGGTEFDKIKHYRKQPVRSMTLYSTLSSGKTLAVHIIMADFTLRQFHHHENFILGWVGQGRVYHGREKWNTKARPIFGNPDDELIQDLGRATKRLKDQSEAANEVTRIIWAIHFPPWFESSGDNCKLIEDDRLVEKANGAGVHAVLAGHTHVHRNYKDLGMKFDVFCCGTTSQHEPSTEPRGHQARDDKAANSFQVITIDENGAGEIKITNESFKYRRMNGIAGDDELSFFETTPHAEPESDLCLPGEESDLPWRRV